MRWLRLRLRVHLTYILDVLIANVFWETGRAGLLFFCVEKFGVIPSLLLAVAADAAAASHNERGWLR